MIELAWCNGKNADEDLLSANGIDRCTAFGDGVFESMLVRYWADGTDPEPENCIHLYRLHLERLQKGLTVLGLDCSIDTIKNDIFAAIEQLLKKTRFDVEGKVRLPTLFKLKYIVSRGLSRFGYAEAGGPVNRIMIAEAFDNRFLLEKKITQKIGVCELKLSSQPFLAGIKHCNRLEQIIARKDVVGRGFDDGLMLDDQGKVIESTCANVFILVGGRLLTPPINRCGVEGVVRSYIVQEVAPSLNLPVEEEYFDLRELYLSEGLITSNALSGVKIVTRCEQKQWRESPLLLEIQSSLLRSMIGN